MGDSDDLLIAVKSTTKLCTVMLDNVGPELQVINNSEKAITLKAVKKGDSIFVGQYLVTGTDTTSVWLEWSKQFHDHIELFMTTDIDNEDHKLSCCSCGDGKAAVQENEMVGKEPEIEKKSDEPKLEFGKQKEKKHKALKEKEIQKQEEVKSLKREAAEAERKRLEE
ncbi:hypothetical protein Bca52824_002386 [Brassica carinata]|uniref:Uncharacterized protein n=1 Tax=Brassica carinata TaxID=52824 RepID=A0A8X7WKK3_BRACI|nr:hypothetical protein Bca52824_002386 [Brassica carinata]